MQNTAQSLHASDRPRGAELRSAPAVSRSGLAAALTLFAVAFGVALAVSFGTGIIPLYLISLPVPLTLLWLSADVVRSDERPGAG
jgi:hypothetical protein